MPPPIEFKPLAARRRPSNQVEAAYAAPTVSALFARARSRLARARSANTLSRRGTGLEADADAPGADVSALNPRAIFKDEASLEARATGISCEQCSQRLLTSRMPASDACLAFAPASDACLASALFRCLVSDALLQCSPGL